MHRSPRRLRQRAVQNRLTLRAAGNAIFSHSALAARHRENHVAGPERCALSRYPVMTATRPIHSVFATTAGAERHRAPVSRETPE
jgi:hypothetical protein